MLIPALTAQHSQPNLDYLTPKKILRETTSKCIADPRNEYGGEGKQTLLPKKREREMIYRKFRYRKKKKSFDWWGNIYVILVHIFLIIKTWDGKGNHEEKQSSGPDTAVQRS